MKKGFVAVISVLFLLVFGMQNVFAGKKSSAKVPVSSVPLMEKTGITYFSRDDFNKKYKDNIRFISRTEERAFFNVYAYNENTEIWFLFGSAYINFMGDTCFVEAENKKYDIKKYNHFGIEEKSGKEFSYSYDVRHDDIYITVTDK